MPSRALPLALLLLAGGCASEPRPEPAIARPIEAEPDDEPGAEPARPPRLAPPPARGRGLDEAEVVALARRHADPRDAIDALDQRRFGFALDEPALERLSGQQLGEEIMDYLRKRARVDWEALRGDIDDGGDEGS